jgi:hypothetical protein
MWFARPVRAFEEHRATGRTSRRARDLIVKDVSPRLRMFVFVSLPEQVRVGARNAAGVNQHRRRTDNCSVRVTHPKDPTT